jgi:hypothetical protein
VVRFLKAVTLLAGAGYVAWRFMQGNAPDTLKRVPEQMPESLKQVVPEKLEGDAAPSGSGGGSASSGSSNGSSGPAEMTKAELYERAKELGIEGRSKMSKQDLERAVRNAG